MGARRKQGFFVIKIFAVSNEEIVLSQASADRVRIIRAIQVVKFIDFSRWQVLMRRGYFCEIGIAAFAWLAIARSDFRIYFHRFLCHIIPVHQTSV